MKTLFLSWQAPESRSWYPVGKLTYENSLYYFRYLHGANVAREEAGFEPIWTFPELEGYYSSIELFPLFANRLLRRARPDYQDFVQWLNIPEQQDDPIALLARSGGKRKTDNFEVFPCPEKDEDGNYHIHFFAHGIRHFPAENEKYIQHLQPNMPLSIVHDMQNEFDSRALYLCTQDRHLVGYCPRYLTQDFFELICDYPQQVNVLVERVNPPPTPLQFRLLCNLTTKWTEDFHPFSGPNYQTLAKEESQKMSENLKTMLGV